MADYSLIGYLNQQIQKTPHRAQQQQQSSTSTTTTNVTKTNTFSTISGGPPANTITQPNVFRTTLEGNPHVNPIQSQNIHPTRPSATSDCISSRGGLGISRIQTGSNNITVSTTATTAATGNGASIGRNFPYSSSILERGGSMLLQHQPQFAIQPQSSIVAVTTTQPHKQINMSSSGMGPVALILP